MDFASPAGPFAQLVPMIRTLGVIIIGVGGCLLFGMIGSMTYSGVGAILGSLFGFCLFLCVGCIVLGKYKDIVRGGGDIFDLPDIVCEHGAFSMTITVHSLVTENEEKGMFGGMFASEPDTFVQVRCGINPIKSTCVRGDRKWNEKFRLNVRAKDKSICCDLLDQNMLGDSKMGQVTLDITDDILDPGWPQEARFKVEGDAKRKNVPKAELILSFDFDNPADFSEAQQEAFQEKNPMNWEKRERRRMRSTMNITNFDKVQTYGTLKQPGSAYIGAEDPLSRQTLL